MRALQVMVHRGSLRAAEEPTGHNYETIAVWLERLGDHAEALTELLVRDLHLSEVELDELWSFVGRAANRYLDGSGERWGCMSIDRASRFVVTWASGPRDETLAEQVVATTRQRTAGQTGIPYVTDGWKPYAETIRTTY